MGEILFIIGGLAVCRVVFWIVFLFPPRHENEEWYP